MYVKSKIMISLVNLRGFKRVKILKQNYWKKYKVKAMDKNMV